MLIMRPCLVLLLIAFLLNSVVISHCKHHANYLSETYGCSINDVPGIAAASASTISDVYVTGVTGIFCVRSCIAVVIQEGTHQKIFFVLFLLSSSVMPNS